MATASCSLVSVVLTLCLCGVSLAANLGPYTGYQRPGKIAYEAADPLSWASPEELDETIQRELYRPALMDNSNRDDELLEDMEQLGEVELPAKRGGRLPVAFVCSPKTAGCLNGGRGPKITPLRSHKLAMCVCLCPTQLKGPRCTKV